MIDMQKTSRKREGFLFRLSDLQRRNDSVGRHRMHTNRAYRIAMIPGKGIGKEVVPEGVRVLEAAAK